MAKLVATAFVIGLSMGALGGWGLYTWGPGHTYQARETAGGVETVRLPPVEATPDTLLVWPSAKSI